MKPIIELYENDFGDILQFSLLWRWNSQSLPLNNSREQKGDVVDLLINSALNASWVNCAGEDISR